MPQQAVNAANYEHLEPFPEGSQPDRDFLINLIVETPRGIRHKYAFDAHSGLFKLKATIPEGLAWPYDYGFIPGTLGADGDPLDVLFLVDAPTFAGCLAEARLLGVVRVRKNGEQNDRLIAAPKRIDGVAQSTDAYDKIGEMPRPIIDSLCRFLVDYSEGTGNDVQCEGVEGRRRALEAVRAGANAFKQKRV